MGADMGIFRHYLTLVLFAAGLLFGVQAPNFVDQYEKRIDAHLIEAKAQLAGYFKIADKLYNGDLNGLIQKHARSDTEAFRAENQILIANYDRLQRFELAHGALNSPLVGKVIHVLFFPEKDVLKETIHNYTAAFPMTTDAILCGLAGAVILCVFFELIYGFAVWIAGRLKESKAQRINEKLSQDI